MKVHSVYKSVQIILLLALFAAGSALLADEKDKPLPRENVRRWLALKPQEKAQLISKYRKWQSLPETQREKIRERFASLKKMTPHELALIRDNYKKYCELSPEERAGVWQKFQNWKHLKEKLLQQLPEPERHDFGALPLHSRHTKILELFNQMRRRKYRQFADWNLSHEEREKLRSFPEPEFLGAARNAMREQAQEECRRFFAILPKEERERLLNMPEPERERALRALILQQFNRRKDQLWEKLSEQEKDRLQSLPPGVFHPTVNRLWHERVEKELINEVAPLIRKLEAILEGKNLKERERILQTIHQMVWSAKTTPPLPAGSPEQECLALLKDLPPEVAGRIIGELIRKYSPLPGGHFRPHPQRPPKPE